MQTESLVEFLAEDNVAGQTLLRLVARGSAIISELLRLSRAVPPVFKGENPQEVAKYGSILYDFRYLKAVELYDTKIDSDEILSELDEEFRENHLPILERFYQLFDSIYKYVVDLKTYIDEMLEGVFVQHTIEGVLMNVDGKQLMTEAIYLYGVMLLIMDIKISGPTRERLIICYYRYKGSSMAPNIDEVIKLCRSTGYDPRSSKRLSGYPESLFGRIQIQTEIVNMVIGRLRADDIYNQGIAYPSPNHRSTALSTQASMLYVVLFFVPKILEKEQATMREIVDKHFSDNWVISFYMGFLVDLEFIYQPYKAARLAIRNTLEKQHVIDLTNSNAQKVPKLAHDLRNYLTDGVMTEEYVMDNISKLSRSLREFNTTLRWLMLHRTSRNPKISQPIEDAVNIERLMLLLMQIAQFEYYLKNIFSDLLAKKEERWSEFKKECMDRMTELSEYFSGEKALTRVDKDENLQEWFKGLGEKIEKLNYTNSVQAGRRIIHIIGALKDVEEFHQIATSLQIQQFLADTREYLNKMIRTVNVKDEVMATISIVSDFSYAWETIDSYVGLMRQRIKDDPMSVLLLRATFLKFVSIMDLPLVRISQCGSKDVVSVAAHYSSELVRFVRKVLEVIPRTMFSLLTEIVELTNTKLKEIPMKVEREHLKNFAQLTERYSLSRATHRVSVFTEGILNMKHTLFGIIEVDPKQLLEDGIRKELVTQITSALHSILQFKTGRVEDFEHRLQRIGNRLDSFLISFEYIQDYVNIYGLKIWQEEFSRVINYSVEQESNRFLRKKIYDWQSVHQSDTIPIPIFAPLPKDPCVNFMGRLTHELLRQTDPARTVFVDAMQGWYDRDQREVLGIRTFDLINRGVGVFGLTGLDRLICFMIVKDLQDFVAFYRKEVGVNVKKFIHEFKTVLSPPSRIPPNAQKIYATAKQKTQKLWSVFQMIITRIGQKQLLRRQIAHELNFSSKLESKILSCALDNLNASLVQDIKKHYLKPDTASYPEDNPLLSEITGYLDTAGFNAPIKKIYITTEPLPGFASLMFLFVLVSLDKLRYDKKLESLVKIKKNETFDGAPLIVGVLTILKQFHSSHTTRFLAYLGQYVRANIVSTCSGENLPDDLGRDVRNILVFCEEFCKFGDFPRKYVDISIPTYVFDDFDHNTEK